MLARTEWIPPEEPDPWQRRFLKLTPKITINWGLVGAALLSLACHAGGAYLLLFG